MYAELSLSQLAVYTLNKVFAREESTDSHWPAFIKPDQLDPWIKESIETQPPVYNFVSKVANFYARWLALSFRNVVMPCSSWCAVYLENDALKFCCVLCWFYHILHKYFTGTL